MMLTAMIDDNEHEYMINMPSSTTKEEPKYRGLFLLSAEY